MPDTRPPAGNTPPDDFDGWWNAPGDWFEEPNVRRTGWSGMVTCRYGETLYFIKKQSNHLCRSLRHPFGIPTTRREFANIQRLQALGITVPTPVFHGSRQTADGHLGLLVTRELAGFRAIAEAAGLAAADKHQLAIAVGTTIGRLHRAGLQHSCLYDKHVMVRWQDGKPEIALIDLEKLRRPYLPWRAARHDLDQLRRHQAVWNADDWDALLAAHAAALGS